MDGRKLPYFKFLELVLAAVCVALHYYSYNIDVKVGLVPSGTYVGYLVILAGSTLGRLINTPLSWRVDAMYSTVGAALFLTSGVLLIQEYEHAVVCDFPKETLAKASLSVINGVVLLVDAGMTVALTCICLTLHYYSYNSYVRVGLLASGTFLGYLILLAISIAGHFMKSPIHKHVDVFYSIVGVGLFIASGAVIIHDHAYVTTGNPNFQEYIDKNLAKGSLSVANGALLLLDAMMTQYRNK